MHLCHSQVHVFCFQALQRLLYGGGSSARSTLAHAILHQLWGLQYDQKLFYLHPRGLPQDVSELTVFYQDLLRTWKLVSVTTSTAPAKGEDLLVESLLHNPHLGVQVAGSPWVHQRLVLAGTTRIGDLLYYNQRD